MKELLAVSYLFSPLLIGLAVHGIFMKFNWLSVLCRPIDRGQTFRGKPIFGENKTYRGIFVVALGTAIGFAVQAVFLHRVHAIRRIELFDYNFLKATLLGFTLGAMAMLSELPNSFIKRQLNVAPGTTAKGWKILIFYFADQIDFLVGGWLAVALVVPVTIGRVLSSAAFMFVAHQFVTTFGYVLKLRATPR